MSQHERVPDGAQQDRTLVEMEIDAPIEVVWGAVREPEQVRRWFGWDDESLPAEIDEIFVQRATADDDVHAITWADGDRLALDDRGERTGLVLTRQGHAGADEFDGVYDPIDEGWITFTQQLRFSLEHHRDEDRRTVAATAVDLGPEDDALLAGLNLRSLGDEPVGARYTVDRADGSTFSGEVFFQSDLQLGLTVAEERDALLVVARTPPASAPPHGHASFILSTYGLDDDEAAEVASRWTSWWNPAES